MSSQSLDASAPQKDAPWQSLGDVSDTSLCTSPHPLSSCLIYGDTMVSANCSLFVQSISEANAKSHLLMTAPLCTGLLAMDHV